jgi:hypothetical protein
VSGELAGLKGRVEGVGDGVVQIDADVEEITDLLDIPVAFVLFSSLLFVWMRSFN